MRPAVSAIFPAFTARFEGTVQTMYVDKKNLVTVGRGNLIDPYGYLVTRLPWERIADGLPANSAEVQADWTRVKEGGFADSGWLAARVGAIVQLSISAVDGLTIEKLASNEADLAAAWWSWWAALPACAQLATHSIAWACGEEGRTGVERGFPRYIAALQIGDWATASCESHMDETGNPGLAPRNAANRALLLACATTDPDVVAWP